MSAAAGPHSKSAKNSTLPAGPRSTVLFGKGLLLGLQCRHLLCAAGLECCGGLLRISQLCPECSAVGLGAGCKCFCICGVRLLVC